MHLGRNNLNKRLNYSVVSGKLFYSIKYLVLVIDHIDHISSKISKSVNIIAKLKRH